MKTLKSGHPEPKCLMNAAYNVHRVRKERSHCVFASDFNAKCWSFSKLFHWHT